MCFLKDGADRVIQTSHAACRKQALSEKIEALCDTNVRENLEKSDTGGRCRKAMLGVRMNIT